VKINHIRALYLPSFKLGIDKNNTENKFFYLRSCKLWLWIWPQSHFDINQNAPWL